jgi:hypothetical protein
MPVVAMRMLLGRAGMRNDQREIAQSHVLAQQGAEKLEQETVGERVRRAEGVGHLRRDIVARTSHLEKPVWRRFRRLGAHRGQICSKTAWAALSVSGASSPLAVSFGETGTTQSISHSPPASDARATTPCNVNICVFAACLQDGLGASTATGDTINSGREPPAADIVKVVEDWEQSRVASHAA